MEAKKPGRGGKTPMPLKTKLLFAALFFAITAVFVSGVVLAIREMTYIPEQEYVPPPTNTFAPTPSPTLSPTPSASAEPGATPSPTPQPTIYIPPLPVKIYFPRLKIATDILPAGINTDGEMAAADDAHIATWYMNGASPGELGNAIIAGHVRWKGKVGDFSKIHELTEEDDVVIEFREGYTRTFRPVSNDIFKLDEIPEWVMDVKNKDEARVTLITCAGDFDRQLGTSVERNVVVLREVTD